MAGEVAPDGFRDQFETIQTFLRDQPVEFAVLFGSVARGSMADHSDIDVAIKFAPDLDRAERFQRRNLITGKLMARLGTDHVDVSDLEALPVEIAHAALRDGIPLIGEQASIDEHRAVVERRYEATADEREHAREELFRRIRQGRFGQKEPSRIDDDR